MQTARGLLDTGPGKSATPARGKRAGAAETDRVNSVRSSSIQCELECVWVLRVSAAETRRAQPARAFE